ncbi:MAG: DEAD/DEAH box helicase [Bacteroidota bacterium]
MKFSEYNIAREIKESLEELGFKRPTDIQYKAIPSILNSEDVLAIAQTGTGKTAAFAIPVINLLFTRKKFDDNPGIKCVVMVPTHELAIQISEVFSKIGKYTDVRTLGVFGGVDQAPQIQALKEGVDIIIATPGRLFDLVSQRHIKLRSLEILILDEADHMLDMGFYKDIKELTTYIPEKRQTLFFSATINEKIKDLAYSLVKNAIRIQVSPKDPVSKNVDHAVMFVAMDDKRFFLERLVNEHPDTKVLVFVRTKVRAERVMAAMERVGIKAITMHGGKDQQDRLAIMEKFRTGETKLLIATDVSARGIDIAGVNYVINYDLPDEAENYVHRVGRTGRGTSKGHAVSFCSEEEKPILKEIENYLTKPVRVIEVKKEDYSQTLLHTEDTTDNWKLLMRDAAQLDKTKPKKKNKKK